MLAIFISLKLMYIKVITQEKFRQLNPPPLALL